MWNFCDFQWATCHCGNVRKYKPFLAFLSKVSHSFSAHDFAKAIFMLNYNFIHIHTPTHMRAHTHTHTHVYIYIHTHTHTILCGTQDLSSPSGIEPVPIAVETWSPNHWTVREFPKLNNISLNEYTTFCLPTHLLMDIWVVSKFWLF